MVDNSFHLEMEKVPYILGMLPVVAIFMLRLILQNLSNCIGSE